MLNNGVHRIVEVPTDIVRRERESRVYCSADLESRSGLTKRLYFMRGQATMAIPTLVAIPPAYQVASEIIDTSAARDGILLWRVLPLLRVE